MAMVTINHPEVRNALNVQAWSAIDALIDTVQPNTDIRICRKKVSGIQRALN